MVEKLKTVKIDGVELVDFKSSVIYPQTYDKAPTENIAPELEKLINIKKERNEKQEIERSLKKAKYPQKSRRKETTKPVSHSLKPKKTKKVTVEIKNHKNKKPIKITFHTKTKYPKKPLYHKDTTIHVTKKKPITKKQEKFLKKCVKLTKKTKAKTCKKTTSTKKSKK